MLTWLNRKYPNFGIGFTSLLLATLLFASCGVRKTIPQNAHLLKKNTVRVHANIPSNEIYPQILHRANKRVLLEKVPIYLWAYAIGTKRKHPELSDSVRWRAKFRNKLGEPPVLVDTSLVQLSISNIRNYLFNKGYFDAVVTANVHYTKRKAKVKYNVYPKDVYRINSVFMRPQDTSLAKLMYEIAVKSEYFRIYWPVDLNKMSEARNYMAAALRNMGYYTINPESFYFNIDTLKDKKEGEVNMILENTASGEKHHIYSFGKVIVRLETSQAYKTTQNPKSVWLNKKLFELNQYPINAETLDKLVFFDSGGLFNQHASELTYQSLVQIGIFSIVDIRFNVDSTNHIIQTTIDLKTSPRMAFSIEPQGLYSPQGTSGTNFQTTNQRSFGMAGILSFTNKNLGKNGENLRISSITSYEAILKRDTTSIPFFGFQQGFNASLSLPHFNLLNTIDKNNRSVQRNTVISLSYQFEKNKNFLRSAIPASLTFQFVQPKFSWYYTPTEVSFNRNVLGKEYASSLPKTDSIFISRVFRNQFLTAAKIGFIYSNNRKKPGETFVFTRAGLETSGNLHHAIRSFEKTYNPDSVYALFGLQYFQYAKIEGEIRIRQNIDELNSVALRVNTGICMPYGNSNDVPYDKRYFIGGSNSLRAWRPRRLGPGSTPEDSNFIIDRSGEFLFEGNLEYRFTVIKQFIESALFLDIGNVWNLNRKGQTASPEGILRSSTFADDLALNTGIGFRFDFTFFLFRVDWGLPLRDPSKKVGDRWLVTRENFTDPLGYIAKETALAFGIGYPF